MRFVVPLALLSLVACGPPEADVSGELKLWHTVTLTFEGPETNERANPSPFLAHQLDVTLTAPSGERIAVPGFFAADGNAAESGASSGSVWQARWTPTEAGEWSYEASITSHGDVGAGTVAIGPSDKQAPDFRGRGMLEYVGERYPVFAGSGERFLKGGADSQAGIVHVGRGLHQMNLSAFKTKGSQISKFVDLEGASIIFSKLIQHQKSNIMAG